MQEPNPKFLTYQNPEDSICIEVRLEDENVWLELPQIAQLFGVDESAVVQVIQESLNDELLITSMTVRDFRTFVDARNNVEIDYFGLYVISTVGYHLDYRKAHPFVTWAKQKIDEDIIKTSIEYPNDPKSKSPRVNFIKLKARLMAKGIDITPKMVGLIHPLHPSELKLEPGIWMDPEDEKERKKKDDDLKNPPEGPSLN